MVVTPTPPRLPDALTTLAAWDVKTRLCPDTHVMQFTAGAGLLDWQRSHLEDCRSLFTEALRWQAGLCIRCGDDVAKRPKDNPRMPCIWCSSCYDRGAWEEWSWGVPIKSGPTAKGKAVAVDPFADFPEEEMETPESLPSLFASDPVSP